MRWCEGHVGRSPLAAGLLVALLAAPLLLLVHHSPPPRIAAARATRLALAAPEARAALGSGRGLSTRVESFDGRLTRVDLFRGERIVAAAGLTPAGRVAQFEDYAVLRVPYGNWIAYQPAVLIGLSCLFLLMSAVWPLRRLRNLDTLAALALTGSVVLFAQRYLQLSLLAAGLPLVYLLARCAAIGLGIARPPTGDRSLIDLLTAPLPVASRRRILRLTLAAVAVGYLLIAVSSPGAVDVIYAVMEGATRLLHGVLPYGHLPGDVVHGDTYPLLSYLAYVPLAAVAPVRSVWDSVDLALGVTALAALGSAGMLWSSRGGGEMPVPEEERLRLALAWLCFPPVLIATSSGTTDLPLAAMLLGAVLLWRRPAVCAALLTTAGWFKLAPFALLPLALAARRGRPLARSVVAAGGVTLPLIGVLIVLGGIDGPIRMLHGIAFQFTRGSPQSVWAAFGLSRWQPLAQAGAAGLIVAAVARLRLVPEAGRAEVAGLTAAVLLALQLAANYWSFLYLAWFAPLLTLALSAPVPVAAAWPLEVRRAPALPAIAVRA